MLAHVKFLWEHIKRIKRAAVAADGPLADVMPGIAIHFVHAPGGFLCPCHGSRFDLAGRVVKNVPAPTNLDIPEYSFVSPTSVQIG